MDPDIEVTFVDGASEEVFARAHVPASQLPESFAVATTLHLGELDWHVESATPSTRAEFVATKKLLLRLRKVEHVDPKKILYSLSSIENSIPPTDGDPITGGELVLHEDDWRQMELISLIHEPVMDEELDAIGQIHLNARVGAGFEKIHVRTRLPLPIAPNTVKVEALGAVNTRGLTFRGATRRVRGGFVVDLGATAWFYGLEHGGDVRTLGLSIEGQIEDDALRLLAELQRNRALVFVDWLRCRTGMQAFFEE